MGEDPSAGVGRRELLLGAALAAAAPAIASAQAESGDGEIVPLWPGKPPGAPEILPQDRVEVREDNGAPSRVATAVGLPTMAVLRPPRPNGSALLIIPGGGYVNEWFDKEGYAIARRFLPAGITAFVLRYRLPSDGWTDRAAAPLQDAQRAMRLIRSGGARFGVDPKRVAAMGFSAGGHLAASLSTAGGLAYKPVDAADGGPTRPDLAALIYAVTDLAPKYIAPDVVTKPLLGASLTDSLIAAHSPRRLVDSATPPSFLTAAWDDPLVPVENTLDYLTALRTNKVAAEAHVFENGGHGFALAPGLPAHVWPDLFLAWAGRHGFLRA